MKRWMRATLEVMEKILWEMDLLSRVNSGEADEGPKVPL